MLKFNHVVVSYLNKGLDYYIQGIGYTVIVIFKLENNSGNLKVWDDNVDILA